MSDDLANSWGVNLCIPEERASRFACFRSPEKVPNKLLDITEKNSSAASLMTLVAAETTQFVFGRVSICGSQANSWCIDDVTDQNASRCLFGAGSYVSGDGSALQSYSTSDFSTGDELALIALPTQIPNPSTRANTVPLPYHIPGVMDAADLEAYEDECLQAVHIRLCWAKMRRKPYKAILFELMLAGNGAILSDRALVSIGKLATAHELGIVVDEIMTGGRTGAMFYLFSKPPSFQAAVTHITFGKWCRMGMIFLSKSWAAKRKIMYPFKQRGASTFLSADAAVQAWKCVKSNLEDIPEKRHVVLEKLKIKAAHAWGEGLIVFGPVRRETQRGLKCRYLPLIHAGMKIGTANRSNLMMAGDAYMKHVHQKIMLATIQWIGDVPQPAISRLCLSPAEKKSDAESLSDFAFIAKLIKSSSERDQKTSDEWMKDCMRRDTNRSQGESTLGRLKVAGFIGQTQCGKTRKRKWMLREGVISPWKSEDFDETPPATSPDARKRIKTSTNIVS